MNADPGDWPTPDGNGEPPPTPCPGEPELPTWLDWFHMVALMRAGSL